MVEQLSGDSLSNQQGKYIETIKKQFQEVICKIFMIRHGRTDLEGISSQLPNTPLNTCGIEEIHALGKRFQRLGCNPDNTLVLYRSGEQPNPETKEKKDDMLRIIQSRDILRQYDIGTFEEEILLDTTEKIVETHPETGKTVIRSVDEHHPSSAAQYYGASKLMEKLRKDEKYRAYDNILLIAHKSNDAILEILEGKGSGDPTILDPKRVKTGRIYEGDIGVDKEYINYAKEKDILNLCNENISSVLNVLRQKKGLKCYIESFFRKELQIHELQNEINAHFSNNPELYERYLGSDNEELRIFCLANMMRLGLRNSVLRNMDHIVNSDDISYLTYVVDIVIDSKREKKVTEVHPEDLLNLPGLSPEENEKMIKSASKLVLQVVREYFGDKGDDLFLIEAGYMGFKKAIERFEDGKGYRFITYAMHVVKNEMLIRYTNRSHSIGFVDAFLRAIYLQEKDNSHIKGYIADKIKGDETLRKRVEYYEKLKEYHKNDVQKEIDKIKDRSLDERYHTVDDDQREKYPKDIKIIDNNFSISDVKVENDCLSILENDQIVVLEGDGGAGKSFFSVYLQEQLRRNKFQYKRVSYCPVFLQLIGKDMNDVSKEIEKGRKHFEGYGDKLVYFLESLDESRMCNEDGIKRLLEYIRENNMKAIVSTRAGYLDNENMKKYTITGMRNPMQYVKDYFDGNKQKIDQYIVLQTKLGEEYMQKNSLFVVILCELIAGGYDQGNIETKWELFGAIVDQRLRKWEGMKQGRELNTNTKRSKSTEIEDDEIKRRMDILEEIAYKKYIDTEMNMDVLFGDLDPESLSFLFKIDKNGNYNFIHKDFEEYFLLMYFKKRPEELVKICSDSYKENDNQKALSVLFMVISKGYKDIAELILNKGYNIDVKDDRGRNILLMACEIGQLDIVKWLVDEKGMKINVQDKSGANMLVYAYVYGQLAILKWLVDERGMDINSLGDDVLIYACKIGQLDIAKWLVDEKGMDINVPDGRGKNGFIYACEKGQLAIVKWLVDEKRVNIYSKYGEDGLISAYKKGRFEIVEWLVDKGFMPVSEEGQLAIVKWLVDGKGMDIANMSHEDGEDGVLLYDSDKGDFDLVELLLDKKGSFYYKKKHGKSLFLMACEKGQLAIVKWLVDEKGVNICGKDGLYGLMSACEKGYFEIVDWLINNRNMTVGELKEYVKITEKSKTLMKEKIMQILEKKIDEIRK